MSEQRILTSAGLLTVLSLASATGAHAVSCGDTITTSTTLTADLGPCGTNPALTVQGPATLNLNGHTVSCISSQNGIRLTNRGATLRNGVVTACQDGVVLDGTGDHRVERIVAKDNNSSGFQGNFTSIGNTLTQSAAVANGGDGFTMEGDETALSDNTATGNSDSGFDVEGDQSSLRGNRATNNGGDGFTIDAAEAKVSKNVAQQNGDSGFTIGGSNQAVGQNQTFANGFYGINFYGTDSKLQKNTALGNGFRDLSDSDPNCDNNTWANNTFGIKDPACVK